jgi:hypothetical protein
VTFITGFEKKIQTHIELSLLLETLQFERMAMRKSWYRPKRWEGSSHLEALAYRWEIDPMIIYKTLTEAVRNTSGSKPP